MIGAEINVNTCYVQYCKIPRAMKQLSRPNNAPCNYPQKNNYNDITPYLLLQM